MNTEYVCIAVPLIELDTSLIHTEYLPNERVVRCRDCKHATEHRSKSIFGTELVTLTCSGPVQGAYSEGADVEPDGFCSWAEPREGE